MSVLKRWCVLTTQVINFSYRFRIISRHLKVSRHLWVGCCQVYCCLIPFCWHQTPSKSFLKPLCCLRIQMKVFLDFPLLRQSFRVPTGITRYRSHHDFFSNLIAVVFFFSIAWEWEITQTFFYKLNWNIVSSNFFRSSYSGRANKFLEIVNLVWGSFILGIYGSHKYLSGL